jgi:hypothetical protein
MTTFVRHKKSDLINNEIAERVPTGPECSPCGSLADIAGNTGVLDLFLRPVSVPTVIINR